MKKRLQDFIAGMLVCSIFLSVPVLASGMTKTIKAVFNQVTVKIDGKAVNGDNITYNNNVYIRADKVGDTLGKAFKWDKKKNIVDINSPVQQNNIKEQMGAKDLSLYRNSYYKMSDNDKKIYSIMYSNFRGGYIKDNKYYFDINQIINILELLTGNYEIEKSKNPYIDGQIIFGSHHFGNTKYIMMQNYYIKSELKYKDINTTYNYGSIVSIIDDKAYNFSEEKDNTIGGEYINNNYVMCLDDVLNYFGYKQPIKIECDDKNKALVFTVKPTNIQKYEQLSINLFELDGTLKKSVYSNSSYENPYPINIIKVTRNNEIKYFCNYNPSNYFMNNGSYTASGDLPNILKLIFNVYKNGNSNNSINFYEYSNNLASKVLIEKSQSTDLINPTQTYSYSYNGKKVNIPNEATLTGFYKDKNGIEFLNKNYISLDDLFKYWDINKTIEYVEDTEHSYYLVK